METIPGGVSSRTSTVPDHIPFLWCLYLLSISKPPLSHVCPGETKVLEDVSEIENRTADGYTATTKIYTEDTYSKISDGTLCNIKGWTIQTVEPFGKIYNAYGWNPHDLL